MNTNMFPTPSPAGGKMQPFVQKSFAAFDNHYIGVKYYPPRRTIRHKCHNRTWGSQCAVSAGRWAQSWLSVPVGSFDLT